jgi:hypothetical protein
MRQSLVVALSGLALVSLVACNANKPAANPTKANPEASAPASKDAMGGMGQMGGMKQ